MRRSFAFAAAVALLAAAPPANHNASGALRIEGGPGLRRFLQKYLSTYPSYVEQDSRYSAAAVSLDGKPKHQILVYVSGQWWCGSGGCTALVLEPEGSSFRVITRFTLVWLPIRILSSTSNGWHDIVMIVHGGGIIPGYLAILRFNGHSYPSNPSMAPKAPEKQVQAGTDVPLNEHGSLLY